jgi:hypothetical protein
LVEEQNRKLTRALKLYYEHYEKSDNAENPTPAIHDIVAHIEALTKEDKRLRDLSRSDIALAELSDSPQPGASSSASLAGSHTSVVPLIQPQALLVPHMEESTLALEEVLFMVDPNKPAAAEFLEFLNGGQVHLYDHAEEAHCNFNEE